LIAVIPAPSMVGNDQVSGNSDQGKSDDDGKAPLRPHEDTSTDD